MLPSSPSTPIPESQLLPPPSPSHPPHHLLTKLFQYQRRIAHYQKMQQRMHQLQKAHQENSIRLLQCVSNVRDLLHSNKCLREQLEGEKRRRVEAEERVRGLVGEMEGNGNGNGVNEGGCRAIGSTKQQKDEDDEELGVNSSKNKHLSLMKLHRQQKQHKLTTNTKNHSLIHFVHPTTSSPTKPPTIPHKLAQLGSDYHIPPFRIKHQTHQPSPQNIHRKRIKLSKSLDIKKKEQQMYIKAQLRRKRSVHQAEGRTEELQYRPVGEGDERGG